MTTGQSDVLVVGAGLTGASVARHLVEASDAHVTVLEVRDHVAGNAHDPLSPSGVRIHSHGPHAFHTQSDEVFAFLSRFTQWHPYEHRVLADVSGNLVPVPCNFNTIMALSPDQGEGLVRDLSSRYRDNEHVPMLRLRNSEHPVDQIVGELAYEALFVGYTKKQWGLLPEELSPSVTGRVPVRMGFDDRYFTDRHQALPTPGYTEMVAAMLDHRRIDVSLSSHATAEQFRNFDEVLFTGPIDQLCDFELGPLPYRSLRFEFIEHSRESVQPVAQINYTREHAWTRTTEFKHMTGQVHPASVTAREFPQAHIPGENDPYYPIPRADERNIHDQYETLVAQRFPNVTLAGRLADYRYYNMDQAVARGLSVARSMVTSRAERA
jgi:UDP-galactopyranose mutase